MVLHSGSPTGTSSDEDLTLISVIIALVACLVTVAIILFLFSFARRGGIELRSLYTLSAGQATTTYRDLINNDSYNSVPQPRLPSEPATSQNEPEYISVHS